MALCPHWGNGSDAPGRPPGGPAGSRRAAHARRLAAWETRPHPPDASRTSRTSTAAAPYFEPNLLERAISEINELEPDIVICSGDLTTLGFKHEYAGGAPVPRPDRLRVDRGRARQPRLAQRRLRPLRGALRRSATRCCGRTAITIVAVDSTEPDLDHGQIGRGRYPWIEEEFAAEPADYRIFVLHHHLLPVPGTGRERNVVYDAGDTLECLLRAGVHLVLSGHKHVPYAWRLENLFVVNTGTVSSLRLRGNTRPCYNMIEISGSTSTSGGTTRSTGTERIIQFSRRHLRVREVHGPHRARGDVARMSAPWQRGRAGG